MEAIGERGELDLSREREIGDVETGYTYFRDGDVVLAKITPCYENGKGALIAGLTNGVGFGTTELIVARACAGATEGRFLYWLFQTPGFRKGGEAWMYGAGGQKRVPDDFVRDFRAQIPPVQVQRAISSFLDLETAKIDALIAEQERLIELLEEKRQAVISHAVTKGLDPTVEMRDSGVEWLGEVPAHWQMKRLKYISPFITVGIVLNPTDFVTNEGLPFIYGGDIREGSINSVEARRISVEGSEFNKKTRIAAGDLLTVRVGAPGVTAVVPPECEGGNCASVMLIRRGRFQSQWLCYMMNSRVVRFQVEGVQYGAAQEQFNISHAINFWVPTPPLKEQIDIENYLTFTTNRLTSLAADAARAIALLQERRVALVSDAVTGKIDVREYTTALT